MPFKQGKSFKEVNESLKYWIERGLPEKIEKGIYNLGFSLGAEADFFVPVDTAALMNSRRVKVDSKKGAHTVTVGYYTDYASYLHNPKAGGKMDGWDPVKPPAPGKKTGGYNANAKQGWIETAWIENKDILISEFIRDIT